MDSSFTIVVATGDPADLELVRRSLEAELHGLEFELLEAASLERLSARLACLRGDRPTIFVTRPGLDPADGPDLLSLISDGSTDSPVVMLVEPGQEELGILAMKAGLEDFVVVEDPRGPIPRFAVVVQRALERLLQHRAAGDSRELCTSILDSVPVGICRVDGAGCFVEVGAGLAGILGYPDRETLLAEGSLDRLFADPSEAERLTNLFLRREPGRPIELLETEFSRFDGSRLRVACRMRATIDEDGGLLFLDVCVSPAGPAEEHAPEPGMGFVAALFPDPVVTTDASGLLTDMNRSAERLAGSRVSDCIGRPFEELFPLTPEEDAGHGRGRAAALSPAGLLRHCIDVGPGAVFRLAPGADGAGPEAELPVSCVVLELPGGGEGGRSGGGYGIVLRDAAGRAHARRRLTRLEKLESTGALAGGLAHDFGNILTVAASSIALARLRAGDSELENLMADAEHAVFRARNLTQQLMTLSGSGLHGARLCSVGDLVHSVAGRLLEDSGIGFEFEVDGIPSPVIADPEQLETAFENIFRYAVESMPGGGLVGVRIDEVRLEREETTGPDAGAYVRLRVSDEGPGIPEEHLDRIFDPYAVEGPDGRGLGLAASYSVIRRHGGDVAVESVLGEGTCFTVLLPAVPASERGVTEPGAERGGEVTPGSGGRVLVMDDDTDVLETTARLLRAIGFEVSCATDGAQALEMCRRVIAGGGSYDAVIMDPTSGRSDAGETLSKLRKACPRVRAIASAAPGSLGTHPPGSAARGFDAVLRKPYTVEELLSVLGTSGRTSSSDADGEADPGMERE